MRRIFNSGQTLDPPNQTNPTWHLSPFTSYHHPHLPTPISSKHCSLISIMITAGSEKQRRAQELAVYQLQAAKSPFM